MDNGIVRFIAYVAMMRAVADSHNVASAKASEASV